MSLSMIEIVDNMGVGRRVQGGNVPPLDLENLYFSIKFLPKKGCSLSFDCVK